MLPLYATRVSDLKPGDWTAAVPLWHPDHPLRKEVGEQRRAEIVTTEYGSAEIKVPDIGADLAPVVAACAVYFGGRFVKAHRISPYVVLETVAYLYWSVGGTPQAWREFLAEIGVKIAPQSQNDFITLLRLICGTADPNRRLGKMAQALSYWTRIFKRGEHCGDERSEDWGWPNPIWNEDIRGTSDFVRWAYPYTGKAELERKWLGEASLDASHRAEETSLCDGPGCLDRFRGGIS